MRLACRLPIAPSSCPLQAAFPSAYSARWTISNASAWIFDARPFCRVISATVAATRAELAWCVAYLASAVGRRRLSPPVATSPPRAAPSSPLPVATLTAS